MVVFVTAGAKCNGCLLTSIPFRSGGGRGNIATVDTRLNVLRKKVPRPTFGIKAEKSAAAGWDMSGEGLVEATGEKRTMLRNVFSPSVEGSARPVKLRKNNGEFRGRKRPTRQQEEGSRENGSGRIGRGRVAGGWEMGRAGSSDEC